MASLPRSCQMDPARWWMQETGWGHIVVDGGQHEDARSEGTLVSQYQQPACLIHHGDWDLPPRQALRTPTASLTSHLCLLSL